MTEKLQHAAKSTNGWPGKVTTLSNCGAFSCKRTGQGASLITGDVILKKGRRGFSTPKTWGRTTGEAEVRLDRDNGRLCLERSSTKSRTPAAQSNHKSQPRQARDRSSSIASSSLVGLYPRLTGMGDLVRFSADRSRKDLAIDFWCQLLRVHGFSFATSAYDVREHDVYACTVSWHSSAVQALIHLLPPRVANHDPTVDLLGCYFFGVMCPKIVCRRSSCP